MNWWQTLPSIFVALALLLLPGLLLCWALGLRHIALSAMAPVASTGLIGAAGIVGGLLNLPWNIWLLAALTAAASALVWVIRSQLPSHLVSKPLSQRLRLRDFLVYLLALLVPLLLIGQWYICDVGTPESFIQAYDSAFHLNAIQYILQTGNASSLTLGQMINADAVWAVYPSAWHSIAALIVQLCHVNVFVAENVLTLVVSSVIWPFACIALVRSLLGSRAITLVGAGILSATFWVFPFQTIQRGPLLPNLLSYCLLPLVVIALAGIFRLLHQKIMSPYALVMMMMIGSAALFTSQPNGFAALMVFSVPMLIGAGVRHLRRFYREKPRFAVPLQGLALAVPVVISYCVLWSLLVLSYDQWQPGETVLEALMNVATGGLTSNSLNWPVSVLALSGIVFIAIRRKGYWMIGAFALSAGLYVVAASTPSGPLRNVLVGIWYEDTPRLAALVPVFMLVLASTGITGIAEIIARRVATAPEGLRRIPTFGFDRMETTTIQAVAGSLVIGALVLTAVQPSSASLPISLTPPVSSELRANADPWVSNDELILMERLPETVPADAVIAVNPFNGSALAYAVSGRKVTQYSLQSSGPGSHIADMATNLAYALPGSVTCEQAASLNVRYILDFGPSYLGFYEGSLLYPGFVNIGGSPRVVLVDRQGTAKLYELTSC
ncbi:DUF6541 family protein [Arthrobacter psychrochitiniphilus]|uniref:Glycosyltransferase RgtA/B/C/D-like domain-containing protein n=1 Tax=Arthrobacter psychrochitiniphilus TaxID=291045 RepID=A0A2V3DRW4_9MICC|nr:DUF6541 family protein [Arthrobacter psychrochitiniphilus]NYG18337.1 hypothetical protein [Arthrobacter psychrochitiniphilus]PXA64884.1 hypothetical protein CVS29_11815 [Arthrobacter psychrochitiniphilus]